MVEDVGECRGDLIGSERETRRSRRSGVQKADFAAEKLEFEAEKVLEDLWF